MSSSVQMILLIKECDFIFLPSLYIKNRGRNIVISQLRYSPPLITRFLCICLHPHWLLASPCAGDVRRLGAVPGIMVLKLQHQHSSQWSQENLGIRMLSPRAGQSDNRVGFLTQGFKPIGLFSGRGNSISGYVSLDTELPAICSLSGNPWKNKIPKLWVI